MSLTGNQLYETMSQNKIKWATVDDNLYKDRYIQPKVLLFDSVELQQQRIRVFIVRYSLISEA